MDPAPVAEPASTPSSSLPPQPQPPQPMVRSYVLSTAAGSCFVALLAVALTMVWRRKQRWRRTRPWLAKLRAETASKIEKEKERVEHKEPVQPTTLKDTPKAKDIKLVLPIIDTRSDAGSASGKRSKERRKRGKEAKPAGRGAALVVTPSRNADSVELPVSLTPKPEPPKVEHTLVEQPSTLPSPPLSPRLVPLPLSPLLTPTKFDPPALVLSGPTSPVSTSVSLSATATELTATTPTTSTSVSPAPASPAFNSAETALPTAATRAKLPAFPPASPLPPSLARKPPPLARRATPSTPTSMPNISRKDSQAADRRKEPSRANEESDGAVVDEIEFPTLSPWPVVGKQAESGKRREREGSGRKPSDAGRKNSDVGRGRKSSDAKKKAGARSGNPAGATNPESTQLASLRGALEAARLREEEVAEERRAWVKKERELQTQVNQLAHQLQLAMMFAGGGMQAFPGYGYGYGSVPPTPGPGPGPSHPQAQAQNQAQPLAEAGSPEQASPSPIPAPFAWRGGSPMIGTPTGMPGMNPAGVHSAGSTTPMMMQHPVPGRRPNAGFFAGSPSRRGQSGSRSRSPFVGHHHHHQHQHGRGTPSSTPSVGSSVDDSLFGSSVVHPPPATLGSLKRERERDGEDEDDESSSEDSDEDEYDSDDDSVIFEDGSVSDSVNLSLHGDSKDRDLVALPVEIRIGEDTTC
ncbi:hypothetical protein FRC07_011856 [Ceratobasidium sp. 392]|nr:hypothetical protein FRC07_011856 [Ceratobasidium sp. 392]